MGRIGQKATRANHHHLTHQRQAPRERPALLCSIATTTRQSLRQTHRPCRSCCLAVASEPAASLHFVALTLLDGPVLPVIFVSAAAALVGSPCGPWESGTFTPCTSTSDSLVHSPSQRSPQYRVSSPRSLHFVSLLFTRASSPSC